MPSTRGVIGVLVACFLASGVGAAVPLVDEGPWVAWLAETVDARSVSGLNSAVVVDAAGKEHVLYNVDVLSGPAVVHATRDAVLWNVEMVWDPSSADPGGLVGDAAVDSAGELHVVHSWRKVVYSHFDTAWSHEVVQTLPGTSTTSGAAIEVSPAGSPHVAYRQAGVAMHAWKNETGWHNEPVPGLTGIWTIDIEIDSAGHPVMSFDVLSGANSGVWVIRKTSTGWGTPIKVGTCGSHDLELDASDRAHIACQNGFAVEYFTETTTGWSAGAVVASGFAYLPDDVNLELDEHDRPHVAFHTVLESSIDPRRGGQPRYAVKLNGVWTVEVIDWDGKLNGFGVDMALDPEGRPRVSYAMLDESDLRVASPLQAVLGTVDL